MAEITTSPMPRNRPASGFRLWCLAFVACSFAFVQAAPAADVSLSVRGQRVVKKVRTWKELRESGVVMQQLDHSCGAAAISTILSYHFGDRVREDEIIGFIFIHGQTPEEGLKRYLQRQGFSLLDLKRFIEFRGYKGAGYKNLELKDVLEIIKIEQNPLIVPINPLGYNHFVAVRGFEGGRVFMADPAEGNISMSIGRFLDVWIDGIGFMVTRPPVKNVAAERVPASERDLGSITAAGVAGGNRTNGPSGGTSSLLTVRPEYPAPEPARAVRGLAAGGPHVPPRVSRTIFTTKGDGLLGVFDAQNFNPVLQLGDPGGNFVDFSPPPGESINTGP